MDGRNRGPDRGFRRAALALVLAVVVTLALPPGARAAVVPVTVAVTGVTNVSAGDLFGGAPDFFTRINIANGSWLQTGRIDNTPNPTPSKGVPLRHGVGNCRSTQRWCASQTDQERGLTSTTLRTLH
jgi:hypothetical protein